MTQMSQSLLEQAQNLLDRAKDAGAEQADVLASRSTSEGVTWRLGRLEDVERSETRDLGLRVLMGERQAFVATSDVTDAALGPLVERAIAMARVAPPDPYCAIASADMLASGFPDLDLCDPEPPVPAETLAEHAAAAEEAGLAVKGVNNSVGAGASYGTGEIALVTSSGFRGGYRSTSHSVSAQFLAGEGTAMERDYEFDTRRHRGDMTAPAEIGRIAAEKAVKRLNPLKAKSAQIPIVYDPRVSRSLIDHFAGAISGAAIARGTSFLKDSLGKPVFASGIRVVDDPLIARGLRSKPFDGEGLPVSPLTLIEDGTLTTWLLDLASARKLALASNGRASRGIGAPPHPGATNLYLEAGAQSAKELIADIETGFYVTELIGMGVNGVTGDYSRGASGYWIEKGEITHPVNEVTVAGNLKDMFARLTPASDLEFRYASNAPTVRIEGMTLAGN